MHSLEESEIISRGLTTGMERRAVAAVIREGKVRTYDMAKAITAKL